MDRNAKVFRAGAREGARDQVERARRIARTARDGHADDATAVRIVRANVERANRSLGRRAQGAPSPAFKASGGAKKTGSGRARAEIAQNAATREADAIRVYDRLIARVERDRERAAGVNKARSRHLKGILRLARKLARVGNYSDAVSVLRQA